MSYEGVQDLFSRVAATHGAAAAIEGAARRLTYAVLQRRSNQVAHQLRRSGAEKGSLVGILADDPIDVITAMLGILKAGGIFVPMDPAFPLKRLATMAAQVRPPWWVVPSPQRRTLAAMGVAADVRMIDLDALADVEETRPDVMCEGNDACSIYFTSGSTGKPKAILGRLKGIDHFVRWEIDALGVGPGTRVSQLASPSFDGFLKDVFVPLCAGGVVCVPESRSVVLEAGRLIDWVDIEGVEVLHCVPSVLRAMLNEPLEAKYFEALRWVVLAGEALLPADVRRWLAIFGERIRLVNLYGPTETTVTKLYYFVQPSDVDRPSIPIGIPMPGAAAMVLNAAARPCPAGVTGEICIRTPYRALGYYGEPELTREVFVQNPFGHDATDLIYKTGDYGRVLNDGTFEYLGRRDQQVKVRGVRVELGEIENLLRGQDDVRDVAVIDRDDASGTKYLCAYVVLGNGSGTGALRASLAEQLPAAMVPSAFVELPELPRTLNGKIDRRALPALEDVRAERRAQRVRARTPGEEIVTGIWSEVLRLADVGVTENFFELGGHSLLATQVISRLREAFQVDLPLRALFEAPTVAELAVRVEQERQTEPAMQVAPLRAVARDGALPLSYAQQRMWFLEQLASGRSVYNVPLAVQLHGSLNVATLEQTFSEVVRRHEVLRTVFPAQGGAPVQVIRGATSVRLPVIDLGRLAPEARAAEVQRIAREESRRRFDLSAGPLVRTAVVRVSRDTHVVLCTMHHLVGDAWSFAVLTRELNQLYERYGRGAPSALPELAVQYADVAVWQRAWLSGATLAGRLAYWRQQLEGAEASLALPQRKPRSAVPSFRAERTTVTLPAPLAEGLRSLSRREGTTLFMTLLSGFVALLHQYTGQEDLVVGSVIANRDRVELEPLIGFLSNTLVLRMDVTGRPTFRELLGRVRETCLGAYAHQLPPEKLVEERAGAGGANQRLYDVWFQVGEAQRDQLALAGLTGAPFEVERVDTGLFELSLVLHESATQIVGDIEYDADVFSAQTVGQMTGHLRTLLEAMVADPGACVSAVSLVGEQQPQMLSVVTKKHEGVQDLFSRMAATHGAAAAIEGAARRMTYAALERRSNQVAHQLRRNGAEKGSLVGILADDPIDVITAMLGILKAGGIFVPMDPAFPLKRLATMAAQVRPPWWVVPSPQRRTLAEMGVAADVRMIDLDALADADDRRPEAAWDGNDACSIYFTSGSTGKPKAILGRLKGIDHFVRWEIDALGVGPGTRVSQLASPSFDGFLKDVFVPLCAGGVVCVPESRSVVLEAGRLIDWVDIEGVEVLHCVPSVLRAMLNEPLEAKYFEALRWVVLAGEALLPADVRRWLAIFGERIRLVNLYGPTETTVTKLYYFVQPSDVDRPSIPIGIPMPGAAAMVLNAAARPCPAGVTGEIYIQTPYRALGYYGEPELTREVFVQNPFSMDPGDIVYKTGDYGRVLNDGTFEYLGRRDQQVKVRGVRVELGEIENLLRGQDDVRDVAVIDRDDASGTKYLCAYVVLGNGSGTGALRAFLAEQLPAAMVPSAFVELPELPRTLNGKIDRRALPALEDVRAERRAQRVRARTPGEEIVTGIWSEVLRLADVGVTENFFELGGHSLLATQVISRLREAFQVDLPLRALFEAPTVAELAVRVEQERQTEPAMQVAPLRAVARDGALPLSYAQQRMWFLEQLASGRSVYNVPLAVQLHGSLNVATLEQTFSEVVRRHEVLRTVFPAQGGAPVQVIRGATSVRLPVIDLGRLAPEARAAEVQRIAREESRRRFDLSAGPLVRTAVVRVSRDTHVVLCTMHHLVGDAWSFAVLTRELNQLYERYGRGAPSALPELAVQYADVAVWQRAWLSGATLAGRLAYWRQQLEGAEASLALPQRKPRSAVPSFRAERTTVTLPAPLAEGLRSLSRREGTTLFMTLLSGFVALLHQYTGQEDLVVGSVIANRDRVELEPLIGFLSNTLVLRMDVTGRPTFRELLGRVRETCLGAYAHQLPPEKLVEERAGAGGANQRLYDVWFQVGEAQRDQLALAGLTGAPFEVERVDTGLFELSLVLHESATQIVGDIEYDADVFSAQTVGQMTGHLRTLLEAMVADPGAYVSAVSLVGEHEPETAGWLTSKLEL